MSNIFSFYNIYQAYKSCKKNKANSFGKLDFEDNLIPNLWNLKYELETQTYQISRYLTFFAHSPKTREIFAPAFRDRVIHHLLAPYLEKIFEPKFIFDVYNNRTNKGTHKAVERAKKFSRAVTDKNSGYYLQLDIKNFFYSIDKNTLYLFVHDEVQNSNKIDSQDKFSLLWLLYKIIFSEPTKNYFFKGDPKILKTLKKGKSLFTVEKNRGLPIGNLTSQHFANIYLNKFDNWLKRELKVKYYIRYVDDFVIFSKDRDKLKEFYKKIKLYLRENLKLELRNDTKLRETRQGLDFLGYIIRPNYILSRNRVINNFNYKKAKFYDLNLKEQLEAEEKFSKVSDSFLGHLKHCDCTKLIKKENLRRIEYEKISFINRYL